MAGKLNVIPLECETAIVQALHDTRKKGWLHSTFDGVGGPIQA